MNFVEVFKASAPAVKLHLHFCELRNRDRTEKRIHRILDAQFPEQACPISTAMWLWNSIHNVYRYQPITTITQTKITDYMIKIFNTVLAEAEESFSAAPYVKTAINLIGYDEPINMAALEEKREECREAAASMGIGSGNQWYFRAGCVDPIEVRSDVRAPVGTTGPRISMTNEIDAFQKAINEEYYAKAAPDSKGGHLVSAYWTVVQEGMDDVQYSAVVPRFMEQILKGKTKAELDVLMANPRFLIESSLAMHDAVDKLLDRAAGVSAITDSMGYIYSLAEFIKDPTAKITGVIMLAELKKASQPDGIHYLGKVKGTYIEKSMLYYLERGMLEQTDEGDNVNILIGPDHKTGKIWAVLHTGAPYDAHTMGSDWTGAVDHPCFAGAIDDTVEEAMKALKYKLGRIPRTPEYLLTLKTVSWEMAGPRASAEEIREILDKHKPLY